MPSQISRAGRHHLPRRHGADRTGPRARARPLTRGTPGKSWPSWRVIRSPGLGTSIRALEVSPERLASLGRPHPHPCAKSRGLSDTRPDQTGWTVCQGINGSCSRHDPKREGPDRPLMVQQPAPPADDHVWAAFETEALPHADRLFRLALWFEGSRQEAEDLVQETMMQALQSFHRFRTGTNCPRVARHDPPARSEQPASKHVNDRHLLRTRTTVWPTRYPSSHRCPTR